MWHACIAVLLAVGLATPDSDAGKPKGKGVLPRLPPEARRTSGEEKLDLILKRLEALEKRIDRLEGKKKGILFDGLWPQTRK